MSNSEENQNEIICSKCNASNPKTNLFCRSCGSPFVDKIKCKNCGAEMPSYNSFCSSCGGILKQTSTTPRSSNFQTGLPPPQPYTQPYQQPGVVYQYPQQPDYSEYAKKAQLESANTIGTVFGFILIAAGIIGIILFIFMVSFSPAIIAETAAEMGVSMAVYYGSLIAIFIPTSIIFIISGYSLIAYRPENNAWKGFYFSLRYLFVGFSAVISLVSLITFFSWIFYNPLTKISGNLPFWLFTSLRIPLIEISTVLFATILFLVFLLCTGIMITFSVFKYLQLKKRKNIIKEEKTEEFLDLNEESKKSENSSQLIVENKTKEPLVKLSLLEERKGRLSNIFYIFKNSPLIGSIELLGASYLISFIIIFILTPLIPESEGTGGGEDDPIILVLSLAWAGIAEEISFRLILIGLPMIFVILFRYLNQNKKENISYLKSNDIQNKSAEILQDSESSKDKIKNWEIPLAIRGKYRKIGYPEWILISISSIIFGFAHWEQWTGSWGAWKIVQATAGGFFLSYAFVKYGIESAMFIHISNNVITGLSSLAPLVGANWVAGFASFVTFSLFGIGAMKIVGVLVNFGYYMYYRKKRDSVEKELI
ncbi:MAG: CPBP family intramembrane metalloprotease [Candidatus Heimdallarchaeota archaeon]|nr:CPBP family intramembrane metalloprotease [Candidatus Heimdallarchaeota archaeon]